MARALVFRSRAREYAERHGNGGQKADGRRDEGRGLEEELQYREQNGARDYAAKGERLKVQGQIRHDLARGTVNHGIGHAVFLAPREEPQGQQRGMVSRRLGSHLCVLLAYAYAFGPAHVLGDDLHEVAARNLLGILVVQLGVHRGGVGVEACEVGRAKGLHKVQVVGLNSVGDRVVQILAGVEGHASLVYRVYRGIDGVVVYHVVAGVALDRLRALYACGIQIHVVLEVRHVDAYEVLDERRVPKLLGKAPHTLGVLSVQLDAILFVHFKGYDSFDLVGGPTLAHHGLSAAIGAEANHGILGSLQCRAAVLAREPSHRRRFARVGLSSVRGTLVYGFVTHHKVVRIALRPAM